MSQIEKLCRYGCLNVTSDNAEMWSCSECPVIPGYERNPACVPWAPRDTAQLCCLPVLLEWDCHQPQSPQKAPQVTVSHLTQTLVAICTDPVRAAHSEPTATGRDTSLGSCSFVTAGFVTIYRRQSLPTQARLFHVPSASEQKRPGASADQCLQMFRVHFLISLQLVFTYLITFFVFFVH